MNTQSQPIQKPNPTEVRQAPRGEDTPNRATTCSSYTDCCGVAVRKGWASFSCANCPLAALAKPLRSTDFLARDSRIVR